MCLAVPMELIKINENNGGIARLDKATHEVDLSLIDVPKVGDFLIVHAGFAIERLDQEEARKTLSLFAELAESRP